MIPIKYLSFSTLMLIVTNCSSVKYDSEKNQTIEYETGIASSHNLNITIPPGWREINDNKSKIFEIWLVNKENNASICFIPVHLDNKFRNKSKAEKQSLVENLLVSKKRSIGSDFELLNKSIDQNNFTFTTIKYTIDDNLQNSIIFGKDNLYYECLAYADKNSEVSDLQIEEIFNIQKEIVRTMHIK